MKIATTASLRRNTVSTSLAFRETESGIVVPRFILFRAPKSRLHGGRRREHRDPDGAADGALINLNIL